MGLALDDKWVWDSWYVRDGDLWHGFFLQADKSLGDPELRHWNVSIGHATSPDLTNWTYLGTCFAPSEGPAWDDKTTWTGSVVQADDGLWHLFYTGTSAADDGLLQRIGHAVSDDLQNWKRVGDGLALDRTSDSYEEFQKSRWHDRAFRDPWVMRDPEGPGWLMFFTARMSGIEDTLEAGAIGFATSPDLYDWTLEDPVFAGGFGHLEVPQIFTLKGRWYCLFCTGADCWSRSAIAKAGPALTGNHYLIGEGPRGPWRLPPGPMLDGADLTDRYAARIIFDGGDPKLLGFRWFDRRGGRFVGEIADPVRVGIDGEGRLQLINEEREPRGDV
ncbi:MAG: levansucrase [Pseudomonadota bacterium]